MPKIYTKNTWLDRIISGALRYDIKDNGGTSLYTQVQILVHNTITQAGSALTAAWMNNIEGGVDGIDTLTADKLAPITTGGTSTAYTLTTIGASALATGETWRVIFHATAGATPTLNRDSKGAKNLKYYDGTGTKQSCDATTIFANVPYTVQYDGTDYVVIGVPVSSGGGGGDSAVCDFRLTLESGVPYSSTDQSAKTTLYCTPFKGKSIGLYSGTAWNIRTSAEFSISLAGKTASLPYDVFVYDNATVPTLELTAWTNTTTRATALTTQDGVLVKTGATTRRYVGTICINATGGQVEDTKLFRGVWNYYNQVRRPLHSCPGYANDSANTTYNMTSTTAYQEANGGTGSKLQFICGDTVEVEAVAQMRVIMANTGYCVMAIGFDTTTSPTANVISIVGTGSVADTKNISDRKQFTAGYHYADLLFSNLTAQPSQIFADIGGNRQGASTDPEATYISAWLSM